MAAAAMSGRRSNDRKPFDCLASALPSETGVSRSERPRPASLRARRASSKSRGLSGTAFQTVRSYRRLRSSAAGEARHIGSPLLSTSGPEGLLGRALPQSRSGL
jgi:hypothetical protein